MDNKSGTQSNSERDIEVARIAYIGAAIAAVADAIALIGDGIAAYAAKLALDALIEDYNASQSSDNSSSSSSSQNNSSTTSSSSSHNTDSLGVSTSSTSKKNSSIPRYKSTLNRGEAFRKPTHTAKISSSQLTDLQEQIEHYINELIEIKNSLN